MIIKIVTGITPHALGPRISKLSFMLYFYFIFPFLFDTYFCLSSLTCKKQVNNSSKFTWSDHFKKLHEKVVIMKG